MKLRLPIAITHIGLIAERITRAFWPVWSIVFVGLAALMFGVQGAISEQLFWFFCIVFLVACSTALLVGSRFFNWPSRKDAEARLDASLASQPISALNDVAATGTNDAASQAVWNAHVARMARKAAEAKAVEPDLRISKLDPYSLRFVAATAFAMALMFGSVSRLSDVTHSVAGTHSPVVAGGSWEAWVEPPSYTGLPSLYLNDLPAGEIRAAEGSLLSIRLYGEVGALTVEQHVSPDHPVENSEGEQNYTITSDGYFDIGGTRYDLVVLDDNGPSVTIIDVPEVAASGEMRQGFSASDDYGIVAGQAVFELDLSAVDRRYGLAVDPDVREPLVLDLPLPISGDRAEFEEELVDNLSDHAWAGLPVVMRLRVEDALGQVSTDAEQVLLMPGRRFFDPLARAVIEIRRDILWSRRNGSTAAQQLRAVTHRPDGFMRDSSAYLLLRVAMRRLESGVQIGLPADAQSEIADALWQIALLLEDGDLSDALERLRRAQERLTQAIREGASDAEVADLMQELREATQDYLRQLAQEQGQGGDQQQQAQGEQQQLTQQDLQDMMDRIQELMEQGRMAEAQELLQQFQEMMENLEVTQNGEGGEGQQSPGEQAMEDLSDTLREQQGLSDEAFRDLQEQFNPGAQAGENDGNVGRNGGQGEGQSHEGEGGSGEGGGEEQGQGQGSEQGQSEQSLAQRQQALRDALESQERNLPGAGSPEGDAARDALGRAGEAMDRAEGALREGNLSDALNNQADAMENLREGMRQLGEAVANERNLQQGQQGQTAGESENQSRDPLGRTPGAGGPMGTDEGLLQGEDVYRRARELLEELRNRSSDEERPTEELEYLKRLLDRF
ncbi:TIGR02302 family protein [Cochlodiniinecator piscidefendens]|nr:TIGR02302 family protein [Cochlodiniinecator piscidefendens]